MKIDDQQATLQVTMTGADLRLIIKVLQNVSGGPLAFGDDDLSFLLSTTAERLDAVQHDLQWELKEQLL